MHILITIKPGSPVNGEYRRRARRPGQIWIILTLGVVLWVVLTFRVLMALRNILALGGIARLHRVFCSSALGYERVGPLIIPVVTAASFILEGISVL